jgi:signal transduction histidine kinase
VRKLVILMNGTIQVQSEVGKGSVFRVQLPLVVPESASKEAE